MAESLEADWPSGAGQSTTLRREAPRAFSTSLPQGHITTVAIASTHRTRYHFVTSRSAQSELPRCAQGRDRRPRPFIHRSTPADRANEHRKGRFCPPVASRHCPVSDMADCVNTAIAAGHKIQQIQPLSLASFLGNLNVAQQYRGLNDDTAVPAHRLIHTSGGSIRPCLRLFRRPPDAINPARVSDRRQRNSFAERTLVGRSHRLQRNRGYN
jgi:hypothetical protein